MTILGSIVLAAALAAPGQAQRSAPKPEPAQAKPEQDSGKVEETAVDELPLGAPAGPCSTVAVSSGQRRRRDGTYSATKTLDLSFKTSLGDVVGEGAHLVTFRVFTPKGHLYQEIRVPYRGDAAGRTGARTGLAPVLSASFPVAGTAIHTNSLYGAWSVVPHLDGSPEPCAAARSFTITQ